MRTPRTVFLPLAALAIGVSASLIASATASELPTPRVQTAAALPGSSYPWVYPTWVTRGEVTLPTLTTVPSARWTQPPAWIPIRSSRPGVAPKTAAMLSGYRWVYPVWVVRSGVTLPVFRSSSPTVGMQPPAWIPTG